MHILTRLAIALTLILSACASAPTETPAPSSTPEFAPVILTATPFIQAVPTEKFIPKHNDLIFVEFFAVT